MPPQNPSPWLKHPLLPPTISDQASFIEYLRWMRSKGTDETVNSGTVLELFEKFEDNDFSEILNRLTNRTRKLADFVFTAFCPWRIRVGGTKGPESMLLPAFDSLGMPYIPSSTLKGIARKMAVQDPKASEEKIKEIFGNIDSDLTKMGQVIFLDAYPLPGENKQGGLTPDMANSIWKWDNNNLPQYNTNPNICLSLAKAYFVIGLRQGIDCQDSIFDQVKFWLIQGLNQGIGSRVNSGYGTLKVTKKVKETLPHKITLKRKIIQVSFELEGQLIHGIQTFDRWQRNQDNTNWKTPGRPEAEVRPVAFRSMLRYWFRTIGLGVLSTQLIQDLEMEIFGGIEPEPSTGLFRLEVTGKVEEEITSNDPGLISGILTIRQNSLSYRLNTDKSNALESLLKSLTWLMFHLGGVGQGARRPCYKRTASNPPWRGTNLIPDPEGKDKFWNLPRTLKDFSHLFQQHLRNFYQALKEFSNYPIDPCKLHSLEETQDWFEAIDDNCKIFVCQGQSNGNKCFALSILHHQKFKNGRNYDRKLCGGINPSLPSPVWIRQLNYVKGIDYQVVTVFGANSGKRKQFINKLKESSQNCLQVFPLHP